MSNEIAVGDAEPTTETTAVQSNMSVSEFTQRRAGLATPQQEESAEPQVEATDEVTNEEAVESTATETGEEVSAEQSQEQPQEGGSDNVLSQLDLDEMSEDDLKELSEKLGSRAVARYGELTAKRKAAEARVQQMEQQMQAQLQKKNPLKTPEVADNPYSNIKTVKDLQSKAKEVANIIEWAEDTLFNADGYGPEDVVTEVEGKELTKADVRKSLLNARKARDKFLPAQANTLKKYHKSRELKQAFTQQAKTELTWLQDQDSDLSKSYQKMIKDPRFVKLAQKADPEVEAQLEYLLAHAANSIYGRRTIVEDTPPAKTAKKTTLNPSTTAVPSASTSEKTAKKSTKALKDLSQRFKETGNKSDFVTLRTLQMQNR